jgi:hypothetical protein
VRAAVALAATSPTARALPWTPVVLAGAVAVATAAAVAALSDRPASLEALGGAALAAGAVAALHVPAGRLMAPLPTSLLARRLLRLALAAAVVVPALAALQHLSPGPENAWACTLALALTGLAAATWLPADRGVLVAAAVPMAWAVLTRVLGPSAGPIAVWSEHPWPVAATAAGLVVIGGRR